MADWLEDSMDLEDSDAYLKLDAPNGDDSFSNTIKRQSLSFQDEPMENHTAPANSSFDLSILNNSAADRAMRQPSILRSTASWDEQENNVKKRSTRKQQHRAHFAVDLPVSVKKKRETPGRMAIRARREKLTHGSAVKRNRAPKSTPPTLRTPRTGTEATRASAQSPWAQNSLNAEGFLWEEHNYEPATALKNKPKRSFGTCTTAASSTHLETTMDSTDSVDTQDTATNFRFTSFPASLPRIYTKKDDSHNNTSLSSLNSEDESTVASPLHGTPVPRTRLNFNSVMNSPQLPTGSVHMGPELKPDEDLSVPYDQHRVTSFASSVSSIAKNLSIENTESTAALTPSRAINGTMQQAPDTPREVQVHFHLDGAGCSPIRGIPEEAEGEASSKSSLQPRVRMSESSSSSTITRPMPDMTAFGHNSSLSLSSNESSSAPLSPKLPCPPTPIRTPAWAQGEQPLFSRSNSLIATKVLATCSPQVLDGQASLKYSSFERGPKSGSLSSSGDVNTNLRMNETKRQSLVYVRPLGFENRVCIANFDVISTLGSGNFADVYKCRSKIDGQFYAIKRHRRQFRGKRDREASLAEVRSMQRLQSYSDGNSNYNLYLLFFYQAWQEDGHFFCQTELCCRDTCRQLMDSLRSQWNIAKTRHPSLHQLPIPFAGRNVEGRLMPESVVWKVCHDIGAGLSHVHSHGMVHYDIKPSNIFFVKNSRLGALCKIGDFGMARNIGSTEDGQEGDQKYMAPELLESGSASHPTADIFSLGLTLYEMASNLSFVVPSEGPRWHELRSGNHVLDLSPDRSSELVQLLKSMMNKDQSRRPSADALLSCDKAAAAGRVFQPFLNAYVAEDKELEKFDDEQVDPEGQTPRNAPRRMCSPPPAKMPPPPLVLHSKD